MGSTECTGWTSCADMSYLWPTIGITLGVIVLGMISIFVALAVFHGRAHPQ